MVERNGTNLGSEDMEILFEAVCWMNQCFEGMEILQVAVGG